MNTIDTFMFIVCCVPINLNSKSAEFEINSRCVCILAAVLSFGGARNDSTRLRRLCQSAEPVNMGEQECAGERVKRNDEREMERDREGEEQANTNL